MNFKRFETAAKLMGVYETPAAIASLLARYALQSGARTVCELGTGSGVFIDALARNASSQTHALTYAGVEINGESAARARLQLQRSAFAADSAVMHRDAFATLADIRPRYDAAVGNPPYIRYQYLEPQQQDAAARLFRALGVPFTRHTNAWTTFLIAAFARLRPGGRLAVVVPAEILHVLHARGVRNYLLAHCARITIVDIGEMLFDALQGAVLVLAEKRASTAPSSDAAAPAADLRIVRYAAFADVPADLDDLLRAAQPMTEPAGLDYKWMSGLLHAAEHAALAELHARGTLQPFGAAASISVGVVTGANDFFLVDDAVARRYRLHRFLRPGFGRSDHVRGVLFSRDDHAANLAAGLPAYLLDIPASIPYRELPLGVRRYIDAGAARQLPGRYKCRIREPWWSVPYVYATEIGMLKRAHDMPRLISNTAGAVSTDTAYRIRMTNGGDPHAFAASFVNSVTALSAEVNGRHYGGGVLELVPSEAMRLAIPTRARGARIDALDAAMRSGVPADRVLQLQNRAIFTKAEQRLVETLHAAWIRLRDRRRR